MTVFDIFSKRQKRLRGEAPDVYKYDEIPPHLRVQIIHFWDDAIGGDREASRSLDSARVCRRVARQPLNLQELHAH